MKEKAAEYRGSGEGFCFKSPEGAAAQSAGLPLRLPWERRQSATFKPQRGCDRVEILPHPSKCK